ncbi:MAG: TRAP transporter small permease subunit [Pseudomonadota bacterium]
MAGLTRAGEALAAAALVLLLVSVAGSVTARLAYDLSAGALDFQIAAAREIARYALMLAVLAALPGAAERGLVRVDLVAGRLPGVLARALERLWALLLAGFGAVAAWGLASSALDQLHRGETLQDIAAPLWPLTAVAALGCGVLALVGLWHTVSK